MTPLAVTRLNRWVQGRTKINLKHLIWLLYYTHYIPHNGKQLWANIHQSKNGSIDLPNRTTPNGRFTASEPSMELRPPGSQLAEMAMMSSKEVPSGESVYYPTAPWYKRLPLWMFYDLPFHKTFDKSLTKPEIELALLGQFYNKSQWEWPNTFDTKYLVDHTNDPSFTNGRLVVNLNDPHHVSNYWGIGHHIII